MLQWRGPEMRCVTSGKFCPSQCFISSLLILGIVLGLNLGTCTQQAPRPLSHSLSLMPCERCT